MDLKKRETIIWIDNLRVLATISVILLHVTAPVTAQFNSISSVSRMIGNVYNSASRFCVPIFVMITGALVVPKNYEIVDFLKKRFFRVVFPFIFCGSIYILFLLCVKVSHGFKITFFETIQYIYSLIQNGIYPHFWYLFMIIGIYLFIPIIGKWARNSNEKEILYFLIIWLCLLCFNYPPFLKYQIDFNLSYFTGYSGYLVLGYYLSTKSVFKNKVKSNTIAILLIGVGISSTILGTYYMSLVSGRFDKAFYEYLTPNVLLVSIGIFTLLKNQNKENTIFKPIFRNISKYSFGIYFVHILVLMILNKFSINGELINPIIGIPITTLICLFLSMGIIYLINKIPFGINIAG